MFPFLVKNNTVPLVAWVVLGCVPFPAVGQQVPAPGPASAPDLRQRMEASVSRQTAAAQGMNASIERQRASVQRQTAKRAGAAGFFDLPAPEGLAGGPLAACDPLPESQIDSIVQTASDREGVDAALIRDVIQEESAFRPCAVSPKGAVGLMQLMPATAGDLGVLDPFDPEENVSAGTRFLKRLMTQYGGDLALTLGAYNAGPSRVDASMAVPEIPETMNYVRDILSLFSGTKPVVAPATVKSAPVSADTQAAN
jgi:soluble lytic murein transglycosylase-like protein